MLKVLPINPKIWKKAKQLGVGFPDRVTPCQSSLKDKEGKIYIIPNSAIKAVIKF